MLKKFYPTLLVILIWALAACSSPAPIEPVIPTEAGVQDENETVFLPILQHESGTQPLPAGTPLAEWRTPTQLLVPIMAEATAGEELDDGYTFLVRARLFAVQVFYEETLVQLGWEPLSVGESPGQTILLFQQGDTRLEIVIRHVPELELSLVQMRSQTL